MRSPLKLVHAGFNIYYSKLRRTLSKTPFIYSIYRKYSILQKADKKLSGFAYSVMGASMSRGTTPPLSDLAKLRVLLKDQKYRDALYNGVALVSAGYVLDDDILLGLLSACMELNSLELLENTFFSTIEAIAFSASRSNSSLVKDHSQGVLEELALMFIQNAKIEAALRTLYLIETINSKPRYHLLIALLHFIAAEEMEVKSYGSTIRNRFPEGEINLIGSIVWGEKYLDSFMTYNVRSMLASGNMPALAQHGLLLHSIVTTRQGKEYIENHPVYRDLCQVAQVEFFCFPEKFLTLFKGEDGPDKWSYLLYGILDHINIFFARSLQANLFLIPVDSIVANPSFKNMRRYLEEGYDCCGGGNLVAEKDSFLEALKYTYGMSGALDINTRDLATLALAHPHNYITSQLVHDNNKSFGKHAREFFWPVPGGIELHSIYTHPLATSARRICSDFVPPYSWVDYLLPPRLFTQESEFIKYKIINNAEEAYINNFAPASRIYEVTGRSFHPHDFAAAHVRSYPIHRHMLTTRQFIPCSYPAMQCRRDMNKELDHVKDALESYCKNTGNTQPVCISGCHLCGGMDLEKVIDLGDMPISHNLRTSLATEERTYPIYFHYCHTCGLLQIRDPIPPNELYDAETYSTGFQKPKHIDDLIVTALSYNPPGNVLDIGCNDGSLLRSLDNYGFPELVGIEPNSHAANIARQNQHHHIYTDYLNIPLANTLQNRHSKFDFIFARHVLEHVIDIKNFFASIEMLLSDNGLFIMELPHVETGFEAANPVILWEEHVNYFTECSVAAMFRHYGLQIIDKRHYAFGGGSVAFIARRQKAEVLDVQAAKGHQLSYYQNFAHRIEHLKTELCELIAKAKSNGYEVALYGAAPRSCTMVNFVTCGTEIDYIIDDRADIHGRYMPGTNKLITALDKCVFKGQPLLVLLGVGAENEHKVLAKLGLTLGYSPISVSLFPPRNVYDSIKFASTQINTMYSAQKLPKTA